MNDSGNLHDFDPADVQFFDPCTCLRDFEKSIRKKDLVAPGLTLIRLHNSQDYPASILMVDSKEEQKLSIAAFHLLQYCPFCGRELYRPILPGGEHVIFRSN